MMSNSGCKGYVKKALQYMICNDEINIETAKKVMMGVHYEFDLLTEAEAEVYYNNHLLTAKDE